MEYRHETVLCQELLDIFSPFDFTYFVDGTLGGGGFSYALLQAAGNSLRHIGLDVDPAAITAASEKLATFGDRFAIIRRSYVEMADVLNSLGIERVGGITLDLGISSALLEGERGFSYRSTGPLDMRMDPDGYVTAKELLRVLTEKELLEVLRKFGEIRAAPRLARSLKESVRRGRMKNGADLVAAVQEALPESGSKMLARVFQALRIAVNGELENLEAALEVAPECLEVGGKLAIISFHSLEDRMVKHTFRALATTGNFRLGQRKPIIPGEAEIARNPRARSAKLRWLERVV
jgi:16S rRNA (cytosine1402-N4)-methyltransferase